MADLSMPRTARAIQRHSALALGLALCTSLVAACSDHSPPLSAPPATSRGEPWARTEERAPCASFDTLRQPFFGDMHIHTRFSADAYIYGTRVGPRDAYAYAQGQPITFSDDDEQQTRSAQIDRPLDFAAVTDHSEWYGEVDLCSTPDSPVYDIKTCQELRASEAPEDRNQVIVDWLYPAGIPNPPRSLGFCNMPGIDCDAAAVSVWQELHAAAEANYDRSDACSFTTFIGYEHTASPIGRHQHRNVIFRNAHVPAAVSSQLETAQDGVPQGVWKAIERDCINAGTGCDAVIIPHNSNLSGGMQFLDPTDPGDAARRQEREPLVEIYQIKSSSECRFDRIAGLGVGTEDELCTFEQRPNAHEGPDEGPPPIEKYPRRNMVRNVLVDGLAIEQSMGANPFKMGFVGSTDNHDAAAGSVKESTWPGGGGNTDATPHRKISNSIRDNPGGLAVAWAEENSRDAIFAALKRRETYATSGTRPVVRFFAGELDGVSCDAADFVKRGYERGTPMGGDLGDVNDGASPRFAVLALKDPGAADSPGTDLQRVQIVKEWVDRAGQTHQRVFDVAGDAQNGASVDHATCAPTGRGSSNLCTVWQDPEFDRGERSLYYVRLLENPACRWSTIVCKQAGVDPFSESCADQAKAVGEDFANCCLNQTNDPFLDPTIQERAWTSPIWYRPEGIAHVTGAITPGARAGRGSVDLTIALDTLPAGLDLAASGLSLKLSDRADIASVNVAPGDFSVGDTGGARTYDWHGTGADGDLSLSVEVAADGHVTMHLAGRGRDLSSVELVDHIVQFDLASGVTYRASYARRWRAADGTLAPVGDAA